MKRMKVKKTKVCSSERVFQNIVNINGCLFSDGKKTYLLKGYKDLHSLSPGNGLV